MKLERVPTPGATSGGSCGNGPHHALRFSRVPTSAPSVTLGDLAASIRSSACRFKSSAEACTFFCTDTEYCAPAIMLVAGTFILLPKNGSTPGTCRKNCWRSERADVVQFIDPHDLECVN